MHMRRAILPVVLGLALALSPVVASAEEAEPTNASVEVGSQVTDVEGVEAGDGIAVEGLSIGEDESAIAPGEGHAVSTGDDANDAPAVEGTGTTASEGDMTAKESDASGQSQQNDAATGGTLGDKVGEVVPDVDVAEQAPDAIGEAQPADDSTDDVPADASVSDERAYDATETPVEDAAAPERTDEGQQAKVDIAASALAAQANTSKTSTETVRTIAPAADTSLRVAVSKGKSGEAVTLSAAKTLLSEYWRTVAQSDGSYAFASLLGHGWLSWSGAAKAGAKVVTNLKSASSWLLSAKGGDTYTIAPKGYAALRLALSGTADAGTGLWLANASEGDDTQLFSLKIQKPLTDALNNGATVSDGPKTVESDYRTDRYLDIRQASKNNCAGAMVYARTGARNQTFVFTSVGNGLYTIQASHSGKLVEVKGGSTKHGAAVIQYARNGHLHQFWYLVKDGKGFSIRNAKSGLAFTASAITAKPVNNVHIETVGTTAAKRKEQRFFLANASLLDNAAVYSFAPAYADSMLMQVAGNSTEKGANVQIGKTSYLLGQYWRVRLSSDGSFSLINIRANKALTSKGSAKHKADVQLAGNATGTLWVAKLNDDASISIHPKGNPSLALDVDHGRSADGTNIWLYNTGSGSGLPSKAQRFLFAKNAPLTAAIVGGKPIETDGYSLLLASNKGKSLDIKGASKSNNAQVVLYATGTGLEQRFQIAYAGSGLYVIQNAKSAKYLEVTGGSTKAGAMVKQYALNRKLHQYWYLVKSGTGYSLRNAKSGLALRLEGGKTSDGTRLQIASPKNEAAQRFAVSRTGLVSNGTYGIATSIVNPLVLNVSSESKASGANVSLYIANGKTSQQFVFRRQSDGSYTIQNKNSGRYLEVKGGSTSNGANIQQGTNSASSAQKWRLEVAGKGGLAIKSVATGKYMEFKGGNLRLSTNIQQTSKKSTDAQSFVTVKAGYNPVVGKIGWQNPSKYYQVSRYDVVLPNYARYSSHSYVSASALRVDATRDEAVEVFVRRAWQYLGTPYVWDYAREPGGGVDCAGLVLQCLYAVGITPNKYTPYDHYYTPGHDHYAVDMRNDSHFKSVSFSERKRGDLVFYEGHVAIYIGNDEIIHAYPGTGVAVASVYSLPVLSCKRVFN